MVLINLYNDINGQIESFGKKVIAEHSHKTENRLAAIKRKVKKIEKKNLRGNK